LWEKVIAAKYEIEYAADGYGWWSKRSPYAHGVGGLKSILAHADLSKSPGLFGEKWI